jgi:hypothetical protein
LDALLSEYSDLTERFSSLPDADFEAWLKTVEPLDTPDRDLEARQNFASVKASILKIHQVPILRTFVSTDKFLDRYLS